MSTSTLSVVTERAGDLVSDVTDTLADVASSAVARFDDLPDRVAELTGRRTRSSPARWLYVAAAVAAVVGLVWWLRGRGDDPAVDAGIDDGDNPVRSHTDRALGATGR